MSTVPHNVAASNNLLSTHRALLDTLSSFLVVLTHHTLYLRRIYPSVSFVSTRAYNYPVRQNRHPDVCAWISDAIECVRDQLEKNTVENVAICIFECDENRVLERWVVDLRNLPVVSKRDRDVPFDEDEELRKKVSIVDLEASFRAVLSRLTTTAARLRPLPDGDGVPECSFTICVEIKDSVEKPVGRLEEKERSWIVAEPGPFNQAEDQANGTKSPGKLHAIRRLEAGELQMEMFVEESAAKFLYPSTHKSSLEKAATLSYGAGTEKFDPENGYYDLEDADVNRKPQGGASTDYQRR